MKSASIIIPAHNEERFLRGLLRSLRELEGSLTCLDVVVVDNGSEDGTSEIAREYDAKLISIPKRVNPSTARNIGVKNTKSDVLVFLDADVEVTHSWTQEVLSILSSDSDEKFLAGFPYDVSKSPSWIEKVWFKPIFKYPASYLSGGNVIISSDLFRRIGGFDESLETGEDVDLCRRVNDLGVGIKFRRSLQVHHEGYPKDIPNFLKREIWHGAGDVASLHLFLNSKVALVSLVFLVSNLILVMQLLKGSLASQFSLCVIFMIVVLSLLPAMKKIRWNKAYSFPQLLILGYVYLLGRSFSLIKQFKNKVIESV